MVRPSKGVHIVVPRDRIDSDMALILRTEKSVLFVLPWGEHWIIGTTDTTWGFDLDHPAATRADVDYLLDHANELLAEPLTVQRHHRRLRRPASAAGRKAPETAKLSRKHVVRRSAPGTGEHRRRQVHDLPGHGRDAVDAAARELPFAIAPSRTADSAAARRRRA